MRAGQAQVAFWRELSAAAPDLTTLHGASARLGAATERAEAGFAELFRLNPHSVVAIRLAASFNADVLGKVSMGRAGAV